MDGRTVDVLTGRALGLALAPGLEPLGSVAELVVLAAGSTDALDGACGRLRALAREASGETLQLALDLLAEARTRLTHQPA